MGLHVYKVTATGSDRQPASASTSSTTVMAGRSDLADRETRDFPEVKRRVDRSRRSGVAQIGPRWFGNSDSRSETARQRPRKPDVAALTEDLVATEPEGVDCDRVRVRRIREDGST